MAIAQASALPERMTERSFDIAGAFAAVVGEALDWGFLDTWAAMWEITERLALYRERYGPQR